jgi:hypothetical protein
LSGTVDYRYQRNTNQHNYAKNNRRFHKELKGDGAVVAKAGVAASDAVSAWPDVAASGSVLE